jgi:hypothetical protein
MAAQDGAKTEARPERAGPGTDTMLAPPQGERLKVAYLSGRLAARSALFRRKYAENLPAAIAPDHDHAANPRQSRNILEFLDQRPAVRTQERLRGVCHRRGAYRLPRRVCAAQWGGVRWGALKNRAGTSVVLELRVETRSAATACNA